LDYLERLLPWLLESVERRGVAVGIEPHADRPVYGFREVPSPLLRRVEALGCEARANGGHTKRVGAVLARLGEIELAKCRLGERALGILDFLLVEDARFDCIPRGDFR